ncbi:MAG: sugar ABC transporter ATP-binding protein [Spirochaetes bacterium GWF1_31_7]|nr:MAG: sugar ABC transporter ATP-binding protein [Spirochaetes bacterium GWE1_32_154]OHD49024.1 MAG: sugar ABC transporter ATP-binding protein [Spirochaetes bacterium GWF1_31_7]OHD75714.1 MAG: sugar ABC transporter ATP-binding protein [Spirochaetes bacterium RIFOXYB1_FULL_32_8]HBD93819.1 sugar ABC transporter ATP-binding protein [Spirochaetia bacterium]HBI38874.1 sugar ABC transporter ATP-binding protein [Spirochaetia bacterium]
MIEVSGLSKEFKIYKKYEGFKGAVKSLFSSEYSVKKAVDDMNFHIDEGESVGYIGVNGAGKSTTIKMMTGILTPSHGYCKVNGLVPYENRKVNAKNIGVVFGQRTQLWWDLPVSESMNILRDIYDIPHAQFKSKLGYLKELLGLGEFYLTPVRNLSLGQKMRADFAASLLHEPKVLFLDEPTIGLDLLVKDNIRSAIRHVNETMKTTVILTTHDLADIEEICSKIIVIDDGKKVYEGSVADLKKQYNKYKLVKFELKPGQTVSNNSLFNASSDDIQTIVENDYITVQFLRDKFEIADIVSTVLSKFQIRDITIEEQGMEDIVKAIYQRK